MIDKCKKCIHYPVCDNKNYNINYCGFYKEIKKGKWIRANNWSTRSYQRMCNKCLNIVYFCGKGNYPRCPYCLAEMEGEE